MLKHTWTSKLHFGIICCGKIKWTYLIVRGSMHSEWRTQLSQTNTFAHSKSRWCFHIVVGLCGLCRYWQSCSSWRVHGSHSVSADTANNVQQSVTKLKLHRGWLLLQGNDPKHNSVNRWKHAHPVANSSALDQKAISLKVKEDPHNHLCTLWLSINYRWATFWNHRLSPQTW